MPNSILSTPTRLQRLATNSLGSRLNAIFELVATAQKNPQQRYDNVWDCCCDHGYLGVKLLAVAFCPMVYFIDQKPHIIDQLAHKLGELDDDAIAGRYQAIAADAGSLEFTAGQRHLVILAGVGGEHLIDILSAIHQRQGPSEIDYILCPTTAQFDLREYLVAENFELRHEQLISEKGRDYEVIFTSRTIHSGQGLSLTGRMWDPKNFNHQRYHHKLVQHYERQALGRDEDSATRAKDILGHYHRSFS